MIGSTAAIFRTGQHQIQLLTHPRLADELPQRLGPKSGVDIVLPDGERTRHLGTGIEVVLRAIKLVEAAHRVLPSNVSADRSTVEVSPSELS